MLKGVISQRSSQRIPFQTKIGIQFAVADKEPINAITTNLNSSGVRFFVPKGQIKLAPDETIELVFNLADQSEIIVKGEVSYFSNAFDAERNPVVYYGVKFLDLSNENWQTINDFINSQQDQADPIKTETEAPTKVAEKAKVNPEIITTDVPTKINETTEAIENNSEPNPVATPETNMHEMEPDLPAFDPLNLPAAEAMRHLNQSSIDQLVQLLTRPKRTTAKPATTVQAADINEKPNNPQTVTAEKNSSAPTVSPTLVPELTLESESTNTGLSDLTQPIKPTASVDPTLTKAEFNIPNGLEKIQSIADSINLDLDKELFGSDLLSQPEPDQGLGLPNSLIDLEATDSEATLLPQSSLIDMLYGDNTANNASPVSKPAATKTQPNIPESKAESNQKSTTASIRQKMVDQIITNQFQKNTVASQAPTKPTNPVSPETKPDIPINSKPKTIPTPTKPSTLSMNQQMIDEIIKSLQQK